ncbi:unnamed protein product, partial [Phaeothamnion confervicola]
AAAFGTADSAAAAGSDSPIAAAAGAAAAPNSPNSPAETSPASTVSGAAAIVAESWTENRGVARPAGTRPVAARPFVVDLEEAGVVGDVRAIAFLGGFSEPALAVLFEATPTWGGWLAASRHTCRLVLLSLAPAQGRVAPIWKIDRLPHDATALAAVPTAAAGNTGGTGSGGGVLVLCTNAVLHVWRGEVRACIAANGYAAVTVDATAFPLQPNEGDWGWASAPAVAAPATAAAAAAAAAAPIDLTVDAPVELDDCRIAFLCADCALIVLRRGELFMLRLHLGAESGGIGGAGGGALASAGGCGMSLRPIGAAVPVAAIVVAPFAGGEGGGDGSGGDGGGVGGAGGGVSSAASGLLFFGSRLADSLLVRYGVAREPPPPPLDSTGAERAEVKAALADMEGVLPALPGNASSLAFGEAAAEEMVGLGGDSMQVVVEVDRNGDQISAEAAAAAAVDTERAAFEAAAASLESLAPEASDALALAEAAEATTLMEKAPTTDLASGDSRLDGGLQQLPPVDPATAVEPEVEASPAKNGADGAEGPDGAAAAAAAALLSAASCTASEVQPPECPPPAPPDS